MSEFGVCRSAPDGHNPLCKLCALEKSRAWAAKNPEKIAGQRERRNANPEKEKARHAKRRAENPEKVRAACRKWRSKNIEAERKRCRNWFQENPHRRSAYSSKFRADLLKRTPAWLTAEDLKTITWIYEMAKALSEATGVPHHVDHEFPLRGKYVSGLHVPENLQILPAIENQSKSNKWIPE